VADGTVSTATYIGREGRRTVRHCSVVSAGRAKTQSGTPGRTYATRTGLAAEDRLDGLHHPGRQEWQAEDHARRPIMVRPDSWHVGREGVRWCRSCRWCRPSDRH